MSFMLTEMRFAVGSFKNILYLFVINSTHSCDSGKLLQQECSLFICFSLPKIWATSFCLCQRRNKLSSICVKGIPLLICSKDTLLLICPKGIPLHIYPWGITLLRGHPFMTSKKSGFWPRPVDVHMVVDMKYTSLSWNGQYNDLKLKFDYMIVIYLKLYN